ncbi:hypothetical protein [Mixta calida]|uniref:hypothetical protein n=1 Tax=Mixta calida TaxID=665913 RepID=UPI0034D757CB
MSLETHIEQNNKLLAQHNELMQQLINTLQKQQHPGVFEELAARDAAAKREECETAKLHETAEAAKATLTLGDLDFSEIIALAGFYPTPVALSDEMLMRAIAYSDATGDQRVEQIDALDMALKGVKRAPHLRKEALLDLARHIIRYWDELPTVDARREFAERLLDAPADGRENVKPQKDKVTDKAKGNTGNKPEAERKGPFYYRSVSGEFFAEVHTLRKLNQAIDKGCFEIDRAEYLKLKEAVDNGKATEQPDSAQPDYEALREQAKELILRLAKGGYYSEAQAILGKFDAKKLGEVHYKHLAEVITLAEKALEG